VVNNHVALNGVDLPNEKTVDVQITCPNYEVLGSDSLWVGHGEERKIQGCQQKQNLDGFADAVTFRTNWTCPYPRPSSNLKR
jgi:hypothetical protein